MPIVKSTITFLSSVLILLSINSGCSSEHKPEPFILNKDIEHVLEERLGKSLLNSIEINSDSSFIISSNQRTSFKKSKNLKKLKNTQMSIFFCIPSQMTQKKYHALTIGINENNEIISFDIFIQKLRPHIEIDTETFYSSRELIKEFNRQYGDKENFLKTKENGENLFLGLMDNRNHKCFSIQYSRYYKIDTMENGTTWSDGYFISYDLLTKSFLDGGKISRSGGPVSR